MKIDVLKFITNNPLFSPEAYANWLDWMRHALTRGYALNYTEDELVINYSVSVNGNLVASGRRNYLVLLKDGYTDVCKDLLTMDVPNGGGLSFRFYCKNNQDTKNSIDTDVNVTTIGTTPTTFKQRMTQLWQNHGGHGGVTCTSLTGTAITHAYGQVGVHLANYDLQAGDTVTAVVNGLRLTDTVSTTGLTGIAITLSNGGSYISCEDLTIPSTSTHNNAVKAQLQLGVQTVVESPVGLYQSSGVDRDYTLIVSPDSVFFRTIQASIAKMRDSISYLNAIELLWVADHFWDGEMIASIVGTWVQDAKDYADDQDQIALNEAKSYANAQDALTLAEAKAYTDEHSSSGDADYDSLYIRG